MQLWTDYQGVTIDGAFPLKKLLMPEGRSAFYSTAGPNGEPTVLRLIECHFDEHEILARWRGVQALNHPNFLRFEHFGQTELDGSRVVYAVLEKVDANLAEVLDRGSLPLKDVAQLASSLVAALDALHTHGFIHEHIEPRNIFGKNGLVKLRSDCIREAPEGEEGRALKQRDLCDLATVLLQGLTQRESIAGIPDSALPPPFAQIIRNGLDGTWKLENIRAALESHFGSQPPVAPTSLHGAPATTALPAQKASSAAAKPSLRPEPQLPLPLRNGDRNAEFSRPTQRDTHSRKATQGRTWGRTRAQDDQPLSPPYRSLRTSGMAALLLLLSTWALAHAWNAHRHNAAHAAAISQPTAQPAAPSTQPIPTTPTPIAANAPRPSLTASPGTHADWRVITFTYNHRTDAEKKAAALAQSHPELQPEVFTPSGHAPYLVAIGGLTDRDTANALVTRSHSLGLPHDIYAQNYSH
jgi:eukaryotic-like serine/threonine-protein kinase